ncbi:MULTISPECIES: SGNH/GDSL hydrolase family protein [Arthrobacter]|uniref:SGNH/GDSL hydrolase family protein n=2 Tax=Arthrobacter TaxID=1663 RepID=A0ABU9KKA4_9MICC|nr:SGNH/GDSL hydrolase family protein [Arthrobacter sp. YJM1]MDP5227116.1 SGNH/GDSL hydrolase family protein [Arthrobacter sp. YJM1]
MNRLPRRTLLSAAMLTLIAAGVAFSHDPTPESRPSVQAATSGGAARPASAEGSVTGKGTALLIGDSQSGGAAGVGPADTWPQRGLATLGYKVTWVGAGGTGYVAARGGDHPADNYLRSFQKQAWKLPSVAPELVVVEGGGNDAGQHRPLDQVQRNAHLLIQLLKQRYPASRILVVGVLSKSAAEGGEARLAVDSAAAQAARDLHVPFVDPGGWVTRYGLESRMADGVHLKASGHSFLTPVFADAVRTALR